MGLKMDMGYRYGRMAPNMKVNGKMIRPMVKAYLYTLMVTFTKVNGLTIRQMDSAPTNI